MNTTQYDREEDLLAEMLADGRLTPAQYNAELRALQRDWCDAAREAAERAYMDTLDDFGY